jgi:hypothetical protein
MGLVRPDAARLPSAPAVRFESSALFIDRVTALNLLDLPGESLGS